MSSSLSLLATRAAACLRQSGLLLLPTETFYALSCLPVKEEALKAIYAIKGRKKNKPLPLAVASLAQLKRFVPLPSLPDGLLSFWPGPLTLLMQVPKHSIFPALLCNLSREVAIRVSSHPLVCAIAEEVGVPITVSSANLSGHAPQSSLACMEPQFFARLRATSLPTLFLDLPRNCPQPQGNAPSTILRVRPDQRIEMIREGCVSAEQLRNAGLSLVDRQEESV